MRRTAYPASTPSWERLAALRKRGQRPSDGVWVIENFASRRNLEHSGLFAVDLPRPDSAYLVSGLDVAMVAEQHERTIEAAQHIAGSYPRFFAVLWRGRGRQVVIE